MRPSTRIRSFVLAAVALLIVASLAGGCSLFQSPTAPQSGSAVVNLFAADTNPVAPGVATIVRWDVSNAASVRIDPGIGVVALAGNRPLILSASTTLTLSAIDDQGRTSQGQLTIVVK